MRRRYLLLLLVPVVALLALGAIPGLLGGGDVYYVVATEVDLEEGEPAHENASETISAENISANRFPYTTQALEEGVSEPYEEGRFGFEESFTHTPFDEFGEFQIWEGQATDDDTVWIEENGTFYRLEITDDPNDVDERSDRLATAGITD